MNSPGFRAPACQLSSLLTRACRTAIFDRGLFLLLFGALICLFLLYGSASAQSYPITEPAYPQSNDECDQLFRRFQPLIDRNVQATTSCVINARTTSAVAACQQQYNAEFNRLVEEQKAARDRCLAKVKAYLNQQRAAEEAQRQQEAQQQAEQQRRQQETYQRQQAEARGQADQRAAEIQRQSQARQAEINRRLQGIIEQTNNRRAAAEEAKNAIQQGA